MEKELVLILVLEQPYNLHAMKTLFCKDPKRSRVRPLLKCLQHGVTIGQYVKVRKLTGDFAFHTSAEIS
ncbi:hypothetical protein scyTo_0000270 [Scyliorhinus torazame]|uniref:Uncharacterized protein n=1 Tax=Scyliorhinus torazame TaxID=75743 RepID=A0A401NU32_SCYTO|nr:hypothetical protein [Scyliorhinus torazame]